MEHRRTGRRCARAAGVAAVAVAIAACGGGGGASSGGQALPVQVTVASLDTLSVEVDAVGTLQAQSEAEVASEVDGTVSRIAFTEGARVADGGLLIQLDGSKLRSAYQAARASAEQARAQEENLQRQVERNRGLLDQGAISKQAFDDLQSSYDAARAQLDQSRANAALARQQLRDASIRAPFEGRVGERTVDVGDYVRKGDPLLTVTDDDTLEVRFTVPESYADRVSVGSPMQVTTPSVSGRWFDGQVYFVSPTVDPQTRSVALKAVVPNPDGELRAGSSADVRLVLERRSGAVVVPEAAVVPRQGESLIFVVRDGKAVRTPVRVGYRTPGRVEIGAGISAGDTIVTAGQQRLQDGMPVRIESSGAGIPTDTTSPAPGSAAAVPDTASTAGRSGPPGAGDTAAAEGGG